MKIIVVEDEPKSREGILNILARDTEYEVAAVCGNGKEGLEAVRKYRPDLIICDNGMMPALIDMGVCAETEKKGWRQ